MRVRFEDRLRVRIRVRAKVRVRVRVRVRVTPPRDDEVVGAQEGDCGHVRAVARGQAVGGVLDLLRVRVRVRARARARARVGARPRPRTAR